MKILITLFLFLNMMFASTIKIGDNLSDTKVNDQFDKEIKVEKETKKLIVVFSKDKGNEIKAFLDKNPNYLKANNAIYFADVSAAPSFVTNLFMIPKFKEYSYSIGLIRDEEYAKKFPKKEDELITIINLNDYKVISIEYKKSL